MAVIEAAADSSAAAGAGDAATEAETQAVASPPGPEQIDDPLGPPLPVTEDDVIDDANRPKPRGRVEEIRPDEGPPNLPLMGASEEKAPKPMMTVDATHDAGRPSPPVEAEVRKELQISSTRRDDGRHNNQNEHYLLRSNVDADVSRIVTRPVGMDHAPESLQEQAQNTSVMIPDAYLVEEPNDNGNGCDIPDASIVVGEPLIPWHRQPRVRIFLVMIFLAMVALAITLGVTLSQPPERTTTVLTVLASSAPSVSAMPSLAPSERPSNAPSSSPAPTAFPTTLLEKLANNQKVASDGNSMVVVTREETDWGESYLNVVFYEGAVQQDAFYVWEVEGKFTVALRGNTATIDFLDDCGGRVVFERDYVGSWSETEYDRWCAGPPAEASGGLAPTGSGASSSQVAGPYFVLLVAAAMPFL